MISLYFSVAWLIIDPVVNIAIDPKLLDLCIFIKDIILKQVSLVVKIINFTCQQTRHLVPSKEFASDYLVLSLYYKTSCLLQSWEAFLIP